MVNSSPLPMPKAGSSAPRSRAATPTRAIDSADAAPAHKDPTMAISAQRNECRMLSPLPPVSMCRSDRLRRYAARLLGVNKPHFLGMAVPGPDPGIDQAIRRATSAAMTNWSGATMRPSGRTTDALRPISLTPGFARHAEGSCLIRMGNTEVLCAASVEGRVPPFMRNSGQGWVTAEYGMLPRATHTRGDREAARGKQSGRTQEIQRLIGRALRAVV